jgi:hypothetical protein
MRDLIKALADCPRVAIAGGPKTGKTTLSERLAGQYGRPVRHTDDLVAQHAWSEVSEIASHWLDEPGEWIVEGVAMVRAVRKWLATQPVYQVAPEPFAVVYLDDAFARLTHDQAAMDKGSRTVWREIQPKLHRLGVRLWLGQTELRDPLYKEGK